MSSKLRAFALLAALAVTANACVLRFTEGDGDFDDDSGVSSFDDDDGSSSVGSGSGGSSASSGSGETVGVGSTGSGGSAPACTLPEGTGMTAAQCDGLPTSPSNSAVSCDGWESMPYMACRRGFEIYNPGQAEQLASCLAFVGETDACGDEPVAVCVTEMYDDACENPTAIEACQGFYDACADYGDTIDFDLCSADLNPFSDAGMSELIDCMNETDGTCQERYDFCLEVVLTL